MQVSVGKNRNEIIRVGVLQFFIVERFVNLALSLPQYQFASRRRAGVGQQLLVFRRAIRICHIPPLNCVRQCVSIHVRE